MQLTENFHLSEFIQSRTALKRGIDNVPHDEDTLDNIQALCEAILQPLRNHLSIPVYISSGYRSPALNRAIGGASGSQHTKGEAADIKMGSRNAKVFIQIKDHLPFDQLIWEFGDDHNPAWVHVSYRKDGKNRGEVLRATRKGYERMDA